MNPQDISLEQMSTDQLMGLRQRIDERLETVRATFIDQAATLGLVVTNGDGKKRKRRASAHKETD